MTLTLDLVDVHVEVPDIMTHVAFINEMAALTKIVENPGDVQRNMCTASIIIDAPAPVFQRQENPPPQSGVHVVPPSYPRTGSAICTPQFANDPNTIRWVNWQIERASVFDIVSTTWINQNFTGNGISEKIAKYLYAMDSVSSIFSNAM